MISVVIPTFNSEKTIWGTLASILTQSFTDFEVIVIDNFSSDTTKSIVESFSDRRVKFHTIDNGGMPAVSRNFGVSLAIYKYIAFCDSDDIWDREKLKYCVDRIGNGAEFISHKLSLSGSFLKLATSLVFVKNPARNYQEFVESGNNISQSSVVVAKTIFESVGGYTTDPRFIAVEDAHLWAKIFISGTELCYINKRLGKYLYSSTALSYTANQFRANRSLRLCYFPNNKPSWYKYNMAIYLLNRRRFKQSLSYLRSLFWSRHCSVELRLKTSILLVKLWFL